MSINSMKNTMCYKCTKTDGRFYLSDNAGGLSIPLKDWKQIRGMYLYLEKAHTSYTMKEIQKEVKTSSNGVFLLDHDEEENVEPVEKPVKKSVEESLKVENAELKIEIDKLNKIIIQTNQINTDLKQQIILLSPIEEVEQEKEVEDEQVEVEDEQVKVDHSKPINIPICPNNKQQKITKKRKTTTN